MGFEPIKLLSGFMFGAMGGVFVNALLSLPTVTHFYTIIFCAFGGVITMMFLS